MRLRAACDWACWWYEGVVDRLCCAVLSVWSEGSGRCSSWPLALMCCCCSRCVCRQAVSRCVSPCVHVTCARGSHTLPCCRSQLTYCPSPLPPRLTVLYVNTSSDSYCRTAVPRHAHFLHSGLHSTTAPTGSIALQRTY